MLAAALAAAAGGGGGSLLAARCLLPAAVRALLLTEVSAQASSPSSWPQQQQQQRGMSTAVAAAAAVAVPARRRRSAKEEEAPPATSTKAAAAAVTPRRGRGRPAAAAAAAPAAATKPVAVAAAALAAAPPPPPPAAAAPAAQVAGGKSGGGDEHAQRVAALNVAMQHLNEKIGRGTIMRLGDQQQQQQLQRASAADDFIPSGVLPLDLALGGGWPRGRIVEIFGPESSGKSTLALAAVAQAQKRGGQAVLVDAEHAFSVDFARRLGVDVDELAVCQPSCGEEALRVVDAVLRSSAVDVVVVDSVAALLPQAELQGDLGTPQMAGQARLMSQALRRLSAQASKVRATVIFVNQLRHKVGVVFGSPEYTAGGQALKYYASMRVDVRVKERLAAAPSGGGGRGAASGGGGGEVGVRVRARVVKNKVAPPFREATFTIDFHRGVDDGLLEAAERVGVVQRRGGWYYHSAGGGGSEPVKLGQGRDAATAALGGDAALRGALAAAVRAALADPAALHRALTAPRADDDGGGGAA